MQHINLDQFEITNFKEVYLGEEEFRFSFRIGNVSYDMFLFRDPQNAYRIIGVFHLKYICPFCQSEAKDNNACKALFQQREKLFYKLVPYSKNRLRWMTAQLKTKRERRR